MVFRAAGPPHISIDSNGNLTQKVEASTTWTYEWNAENQLTRVLSNGAEVARYKYDPQGRRVEKVAGGVTTTWAYNSEDILRETSGATTTKYIHGPGIDEPLAKEDGGSVLTYLHADGLGSVVRTTSSAGAVVGTYTYDAFGGMTGSAAGYAYTGREWDADAQLYHYRARYYDPKIGRFLSEDPLHFGGGDANLYAYVRNRPVILTDPLGTFPSIPGIQEIRDEARRAFPEPRGGPTPDRERHCYTQCRALRSSLVPSLWFPPITTLPFLWEQSVHLVRIALSGGRADIAGNAAGDAAAATHGYLSGWDPRETCRDHCATTWCRRVR